MFAKLIIFYKAPQLRSEANVNAIYVQRRKLREIEFSGSTKSRVFPRSRLMLCNACALGARREYEKPLDNIPINLRESKTQSRHRLAFFAAPRTLFFSLLTYNYVSIPSHILCNSFVNFFSFFPSFFLFGRFCNIYPSI